MAGFWNCCLGEPCRSSDPSQITFLPVSCLSENRPERLDQFFVYLLLLWKHFRLFWPRLQSNFRHLYPIVLEASWKVSKLIKEGTDIMHVDILAVAWIWKPQLQGAHLSCKKSFWKWPLWMEIQRTEIRTRSRLFANSYNNCHWSESKL